MPVDRADGGEVAADIQEQEGVLQPPSAWATPATLASELVGVIDDIRTIPAELGVRPYRVFLLHAQWTGGEVGEGQMHIVSRKEITPPPRVQDVSGINQVLRQGGVSEEGDVKVDEISARYSEDDLLGLTPDLLDPNDRRRLLRGVEFFYEMEEYRDSDRPTAKRRFTLANTPTLSREGLQWTVTLLKQDGDRMRDGSTERTL